MSEQKLSGQIITEKELSVNVGRDQLMLVADENGSRLKEFKTILAQSFDVLYMPESQTALSVLTDRSVAADLKIVLFISADCAGLLPVDGRDFFRQVDAQWPWLVRMMLGPEEAEGQASIQAEFHGYIAQPVSPAELLSRLSQIWAVHQKQAQDAALIQRLEVQNEALVLDNANLIEALNNLQILKVCAGVYWLQVPEVNLYVLCGCPADVVKHLKQTQYIAETDKGETGPNAILLSESLIQQGSFSNLAEFPILQMLYLQGMMVPGHPGNTGLKPILIGCEAQLSAQLEYIYRGNYGLTSVDEIMAADANIDRTEADALMRMKLKFAFGEIKPSAALFDSCAVPKGETWTEIRDGVNIRRLSYNHYEFEYKGRKVAVDLNLSEEERYESPYQLGFHSIERQFFGVIHIGEGDGWDTKRPAMSSILLHQGDIFLIDAGPNLFNILLSVGIDISEVKGIFHTHCHDDHFVGLPVLMQADHRICHYATPLVRASVRKKLSALMSIPESAFTNYFETVDLEYDQWNDIDGLEVKPLLSPHPVENSIFVFRAVGGEGYRSYGHWADLTSLSSLNSMVDENLANPGITNDLREKVKQNYLYDVDLKKIDIGGGLIHGVASDFIDDPSTKIVLAHTAKPLSAEDKKVGDNAAFASVDVLIEKKEDYLRVKAMQCLVQYFPEASGAHLRSFLNCDCESYNPGETILKADEMPDALFLLIAGSMERIEDGRSHRLSTGSFIGEEALFSGGVAMATFRSISHVELFRFSHENCRIFLENTGIDQLISELQRPISALMGSWLFDEGISTQVKNNIARSMIEIQLPGEDRQVREACAGLYLVSSGTVTVISAAAQVMGEYSIGEYFGEASLTGPLIEEYTLASVEPAVVYFIPAKILQDIPLIHWRMLERRGRH
ncbi:MAG: cyclic nucleotide-binding domain-containing protein [Pseudomonadales bacterium]|nr:cyclic nucleotide-binding domain-containing protein [Pseudomonadales bacterium]